MTEFQFTFLNMIKTALWDEAFELRENVTPEQLYNEALRYEIAGIVWDKRDIICGNDAALRRRWLKSYAELQQKGRKILEAQTVLCDLLAGEGIIPVFVKGLAAAHYYPHPLQRKFGDIDFLVAAENFDRACEIMVQNGYTLEEDDRRHISFNKNGIEFECHRFFTGTGCGKDQIRENVITDGCRNYVEKTVEGKRYFTLPDAEYGIMQLEHLSHHLTTGIGFRQYIDWILYINAFADNNQWLERFNMLIKKCNLERLAKVMTRTAQLYLGLKTEGIFPCADVDEEICGKFIEFLFTCDNFGFKLEETESVAKTNTIFRRGFFKELNERALIHMPAARKLVFLRPAAWIMQLAIWFCKGINAFLFRGEKMDIDIEENKKNKEIFKDIGV